MCIQRYAPRTLWVNSHGRTQHKRSSWPADAYAQPVSLSGLNHWLWRIVQVIVTISATYLFFLIALKIQDLSTLQIHSVALEDTTLPVEALPHTTRSFHPPCLSVPTLPTQRFSSEFGILVSLYSEKEGQTPCKGWGRIWFKSKHSDLNIRYWQWSQQTSNTSSDTLISRVLH